MKLLFDPSSALQTLVTKYSAVMEVMDGQARQQDADGERAYGGAVRAVKGQLQEFLTEQLILIAWRSIGGKSERLRVNSEKIPIPIIPEYVATLKDPEVREFIAKNIDIYTYGLSVDKHVFVDDAFVVAVECKAYTENAMLKRILVDFTLLKSLFPELKCLLFQLESQLGGDYSAMAEPTFGSRPTHTLMSYFRDVQLEIVTLLEGERKVDRPINKYFKELKLEHLRRAHDVLAASLLEFA